MEVITMLRPAILNSKTPAKRPISHSGGDKILFGCLITKVAYDTASFIPTVEVESKRET